MKKHINTIIISAILALVFALTGCSSSINNPEKDKKQKTNTSTNKSSEENNKPDIFEEELEAIEMPLTLKVITAGKIYLSGKNSFERISIQKGDGLIYEPADIITVQPGDVIRFYGSNYKYVSEDPTDTFYSGYAGKINLTIDCTADCYVYGNVMSLLYYTDFKGKTQIKENYALQKLFLNNTHIKNHETLDIVLPATTLSEGCYKKMFYGCTSLTRAPELPATTLTTECYDSMFLNCTSINSIKCFATDISAVDCTRNWIYQVAAEGTFTSSQNNNIWRHKDKYSGIPVKWTSDPPYNSVNAKELPLTLEAIEDGFITIKNPNQFSNLKYKKNDGEITTAGGSIDVYSGDIICFYADGPTNEETDYKKRLSIDCTGFCYIYGNIMSLLYSEDFSDKTDLKNKKYTFYWLFAYNTHIKNCSIELVLPATTLQDNCYDSMFQDCQSLTTAPELPATTLTTSCYYSMFLGTDLVYAPELQAMNLAKGCYQCMFQGCKSLATAPELPAINLAANCYTSMFNNCQGLTSAPELPAGKNGEGYLAAGCYGSMFKDCKSLTSAPELPATSLVNGCYSNMFKGCSSLTSAPELPAGKNNNGNLILECYKAMFQNCTSLTVAPKLPATTLQSNCYQDMFNGCTSLTSAPDLPATTLKSYCYQNMFAGCTSLNTIKCSATSISETNCIKDWLPAKTTTIGFIVTENPAIWTTLPTGWMAEKELPLTLEAIQDGTITINNSTCFSNLKYSKNYGSKQSYPNDGISVLAGDTVFFFANSSSNNNTTNMTISCSSDCYVYGNIMSLVSSSPYSIQTTLSTSYSFCKLFYENKYIKNHPVKELSLPATTLMDSCYKYMFYGCEGLTKTPKLPAASLVNNCYAYMFQKCSGLIEVQNLSASTLAMNCYQCMFAECTSLQEAPDLPALTMATQCYQLMFAGCTKLTKAPDILATKASNWACSSMFSGCKSLVTPPALKATALADNCYNGMFTNCTSLESAPPLSVSTLSGSCYKEMFKGCISLESAPELKAATLTEHCYESMFSGCGRLNNVKCLATNISATDCTKDWLNGVAANGTFTKKSSMTGWATGSTSGIPTGWNVQDATN